MRMFVRISNIRSKDIPQAVFSQLSELADTETAGSRWELYLPEDHPSISRAIAIMHNAGLKEWHFCGMSKSWHEGKEFSLRRVRKYDPEDLASAPFLEITADYLNEHIWTSFETGLIEIQRITAVKGKDREILSPFGGNGQGLIVSDAVRRDIERGLSAPEIEFLPVDFKAKTKTPDPPVWWELTSRVTLPPVAPGLVLLDNKDRPVPRGHKGFTQIWEPPFAPRELHYIRSELEAVGGFTLARTYEKTGHRENDRCLIASQRFYRFCLENDIRCGWVPVRIDEG